MKKYLVINEFTRPGVPDKAFTKPMIVDADDADGALASLSYEEFVSNDRWTRAVKAGNLEEATTGIYELVSDHNFLEDVVIKK